jgi:hypothetical protein
MIWICTKQSISTRPLQINSQCWDLLYLSKVMDMVPEYTPGFAQMPADKNVGDFGFLILDVITICDLSSIDRSYEENTPGYWGSLRLSDWIGELARAISFDENRRAAGLWQSW